MNQRPTYFSEAQKSLARKALAFMDLTPFAKARIEDFIERNDVTEDTILFCSRLMTAAYGKHDMDFAPTHLERELMKHQAIAKIIETVIGHGINP